MQMSWLEGDMTNMTQYDNGLVDVVFDKGALDALMSVNTEDVRAKAVMMFNEITRVLRPNGKYICVSLCERYIVNELLAFFCRDFGR